MHNMVQKRFGIKFDLTKLGYPKLKKFLEEIEGIYFDHGDNANHIKARYKSPQQKQLKKKPIKKCNILSTWERDDVKEEKKQQPKLS